jgi:hypothetical protein
MVQRLAPGNEPSAYNKSQGPPPPPGRPVHGIALHKRPSASRGTLEQPLQALHNS